MDNIESDFYNVIELIKLVNNYIDNPTHKNLKILEAFFENLGFYIKKNELNKIYEKTKRLKQFLENLKIITKNNLNCRKDIIDTFATIQAEFQQPRDIDTYDIIFINEYNNQHHSFGYFHLKLSENIRENNGKGKGKGKRTSASVSTRASTGKGIGRSSGRSRGRGRGASISRGTTTTTGKGRGTYIERGIGRGYN